MVDRIRNGWKRIQGVPFRLSSRELGWCCFGGAAMALATLIVAAF